jgi:GT2 family glycosyltransferase
MLKSLSVVIPTFGREDVLIQTLSDLFACDPRPLEILLVDQTPTHEPSTISFLENAISQRKISVIRQSPSITHAMNNGLKHSKGDIVLFLDDDVVPVVSIISEHQHAYSEPEVACVVGQVLQPGEKAIDFSYASETGLCADLEFRFCSSQVRDIHNAIGCNMSVDRRFAIEIGGFDENFVKVAYRFETEFARRVYRHGKCVRFSPSASLKHLAAQRGGTRSFGKHLKTASPDHSVGDYYFAMLEGTPREAARYCFRRFFRSVRTKFHLTHPWYIPPKLIGEIRGFLWAMQLIQRGQRLLSSPSNADPHPSVMETTHESLQR